ncbi:hypothetical protein, partial [Streptomyces sp. NPDC003480]
GGWFLHISSVGLPGAEKCPAPGHGASARPAAHGLTVPAHQDPDTFAVCGLVQDMGLDQAVTAVC